MVRVSAASPDQDSTELILLVVGFHEEIGHHVDAGVTSVIKAGKTEASLNRLEQGKVVVIAIAAQAMRPKIGINDGKHLIGAGSNAVIILVPQHDNRGPTLIPDSRCLDGANQYAQGLIADGDQRGIEANLGPIIVGVEVALRATVAATMLVVALIRRNKGIGRNVAGGQIGVESVCALEAGDAVKMAFLHAAEIYEGVVLCSVQFNERL